MDLPICDVCLQSGILCKGCENKLKTGEISQMELDIAKILYNLGDGQISFKKAVDMGNVAIIITEKDQVGKVIGKGGNVVSAISKEIGKNVRVIGDESDLKSVSKDILAPARISGINVVYGTDGEQKFKIRVLREDARRIPSNLDKLNEIIESLTGEKTKIVLDD
ncbi:MAG: transcription elongation factor NusA [Methanobacteriales archaeon HGW-Methanobacteriales-1]|jgi:transcription antitermination factor NusA-like protein|nr:MAG: transcription elongation factor NusA [Methanobacteriales archaeon HGW-Methanobacteriales-1]